MDTGVGNESPFRELTYVDFSPKVTVDFSSFSRKCTNSPEMYHFVSKHLFNLRKHNMYIKHKNKLSEKPNPSN